MNSVTEKLLNLIEANFSSSKGGTAVRMLTDAVAEVSASYGECDECYGRGYVFSDTDDHFAYCICPRAKQLSAAVEQLCSCKP